MNRRVALLIPYYGRIPQYFDLWLKSAKKNPKFQFIFVSDLKFDFDGATNVSQINISFLDLKTQIECMIGTKVCLHSPYKLCDYKPAYGLLFAKFLSDFEFWGFTDIDLILGDLSKFVTDNLLDNYDKLFYEGHFSLFRNCEKMNKLFLQCYPHVMNYKFAFSTKYACHFDENGTVAWAHEVDRNSGIRFYTAWDFFDVPVDKYELTLGKKRGFVIWDDGKLVFHSFDREFEKELMYVHLQKRRMGGIQATNNTSFAIARTSFYEKAENEYRYPESENERVAQFVLNRKKRKRKTFRDNIVNGAVRAKLMRKIYGWKSR